MGVGGKIKLEEGTAGGTYVGFKAPDTEVASDLIWVLPSTDGTNGQFMVTNGTGTLSWGDIGAEITARSNADSTLTSNLNIETTARLNADSTLQANISEIVWEVRQVSSAFACGKNDRIFVDTSGSAFAASFPTSPSVGDEFEWLDQKGNFAVNALTLTYNSTDKINGLAEPYTSDVSGHYKAVYTGSTFGWAITYQIYG